MATDEQQQAMASERLAEIRQRVEGTDEPVVYWNGMSGALEQAEEDRAALLAEVDRRRGREAALVKRLGKAMAIVQMVANRWPLFSIDRINEMVTQSRALLAATETGEQAAPTDGERHDKWQYIAAYGYWVWMMSHDNWDDCAGLCEEMCQQYGIGVWVDAARPGDYHPAANVSQTEAIRAMDASPDAPKQGEA